MKVLVFGGTVFLGRHLVDALLAHGHEVTLFNRGRTRPGLFAQVAQLHGERDGKLDALAAAVQAGRRWDVAIDCSGYLPRVVRQSAQLLRDAVDRYQFVSSISVYADFSQPGTREDAALAQLADPAREDVPRDYGALKAACEAVVAEIYGPRAQQVRPGLIVGPWDPTQRFTYWVQRAAQGGEMLAPGEPAAPVQFIDGRDLAQWMVRLAATELSGAFNAAGPVAGPCTFGELIDACREAAGVPARVTWVASAFLLAHKVGPWMELPLWLPPEDGGLFTVDLSRAAAAGLTTRPVLATVRDTLHWRNTVPEAERAERPGAGLRADREREVLDAWHQAHG